MFIKRVFLYYNTLVNSNTRLKRLWILLFLTYIHTFKTVKTLKRFIGLLIIIV